MNDIEIIPTVVPSSIADIEAAAARYAGFAGTLHVDFADGVFAPNTTWLPHEHSRFDGMRWEAHLMVAKPREIGLSCIRAGASRVIGHVEAMQNTVQNTFAQWRSAGADECVLGTLFDTPVEPLAPFIPACDAVMIMGITAIGVQGLPADANAPEHVRALLRLYPGLLVEVDGAMSERNIGGLAAAGARRFCAGSVLSKSSDPASTYRSLLSLAGGVE